MILFLYGSVDSANTRRIRVGYLDLPKERKRYSSSREEEEVQAQMSTCGKAIKSGTHIVGERKMYKEERYALEEEMREIDECGMEKFCHHR